MHQPSHFAFRNRPCSVSRMRPTGAALLVLVAGCYSVDTTPFEELDAGRDATGDAGDEAPRVLSTSPVDLVTDAEPAVVITVAFSEAMAPETIDASTFVLTHNGDMVSGQVSYESDGSIATFQPESRLWLLGEYAATVTSAVTDATGTPLASDHSWSFSVRDGIWGDAELIETGNTGATNSPDVAMDAAGNALAVWSQSDGTRSNIWANRYVAGSGWSVAQLIEADNTGGATFPSIAVNAAGVGVAAWMQHDGSRTNLWANVYLPGSGWGTAQLIEDDDAGGASYPAVAIDTAGNAVAVWHQSGGTRTSIWANRFVPGVGWGTAQLVETDDVGFASFPDVAVDTAGNATAVWSQSDGTRYGVWANRFIPGTGWATAQLIETDDTANGGPPRPQVAVDGTGNAVAVWSQYDGSRYNAWANHFVPGSGWGTPQLIENETGGTASSSAAGPHVALDGVGSAIAVWHQSDGTRNNIWANRFVPGTGWGAAQMIETENDGGAGSPQVVVDASGNAMATWIQTDGSRYNVWANRYVMGTGWGTAQLIETDNAGSAGPPSAAVNAAGTAISVWPQSDGTRDNLWANGFR